MRMRVLPVLLGMVLVVSCQPAPGPAALADADRAASDALTATWLTAMRAGDWDGVVATYTADAMLLPPNAPIAEGREGIRAFMTSFPRITGFDITAQETDGRGDIAYVRGKYSVTMAISDTMAVTDTGKYMEIRRKQADGSWLIYRDIFNSDMPVAH